VIFTHFASFSRNTSFQRAMVPKMSFTISGGRSNVHLDYQFAQAGLMKPNCFSCEQTVLSVGREACAQTAPLASSLNSGQYAVLVLAALVLISNGCTSQRGVISKSSSSSPSGFADPRASRFGSVALADESCPASFSFQKAKGKLGSAREAIFDSAQAGLSAPGAGVITTTTLLSEIGCQNEGDPRFYVALAGALGGLTTVCAALAGPVVGAEGLIRSLRSVSPAELAEREIVLTKALSQMAAQQTFRVALIRSGAEKIRGGFLLPEPRNLSQTPEAILEIRVDDLRLERAGSSEGSYFLRIKTCARVLRAADGAVCFEENAEYRSGRALFLEWTLQGAVQSVAETGYQELAQHYVAQLLVGSPN
jgi:hypothetical protein